VLVLGDGEKSVSRLSNGTEQIKNRDKGGKAAAVLVAGTCKGPQGGAPRAARCHQPLSLGPGCCLGPVLAVLRGASLHGPKAGCSLASPVPVCCQPGGCSLSYPCCLRGLSLDCFAAAWPWPAVSSGVGQAAGYSGESSSRRMHVILCSWQLIFASQGWEFGDGRRRGLRKGKERKGSKYQNPAWL